MFFITTVDSKTDDMRCVGYVSDFDIAEEIVFNNTCDIYETCYDYVVIENVPEGLYMYDQNAKWYHWNKEKKKYEKIENRPEKYKHNVGFGIG